MCHSREMLPKKVHASSDLASVSSSLGEHDVTFATNLYDICLRFDQINHVFSLQKHTV